MMVVGASIFVAASIGVLWAVHWFCRELDRLADEIMENDDWGWR